MKSILILSVLLLAGCVATPVKREFPAIPPSFSKPCGDLLIVPKTTKLSDVLTVVTENYSLYRQCQIKNELWLDWYNQQRKIFEDVK